MIISRFEEFVVNASSKEFWSRKASHVRHARHKPVTKRELVSQQWRAGLDYFERFNS